jgi:hypothetical protein
MATEETTAGDMVCRQHVRAAAKRAHAQAASASATPGGGGPVNHAANPRGAALAPALRRYIHDVMDGRSFFDPYAVDAACMRALLAIGAIQNYFREEKSSERISLLGDLRAMLLDLDESSLRDAGIRSFFEQSVRCLEADAAAGTLETARGEDEEPSRSVRLIPTMLAAETLRYYKWLARTCEHAGDVVDLGSWMGSSTACLAEGLSQNPRRKHARVHAYDSFIWRDWMRTYTEDPDLLAANIREGDSFLDYFRRYTAPFRHLIDVHQAVLKTGTEQTALPALEWSGGSVAILVMDFAHDRASNEAMWRVFSPSFQSGSTIVVFNQFGNIPAGEVREFCRQRAPELVPLHKPHSAAKAFRYQRAVA